MDNRNNPWDPYKYIPFVILVFFIAKFIFSAGNLSWFLKSFKSLLFASVIIYLFSPGVRYFKSKFKFNHTLSVLFTYLLVFSFITFFIMLMVPGIVDSVNSIINNIPSNSEQISDIINNMFVSNIISTDQVHSIIASIEDMIVTLSSNILSYSSQVISSITGVIGNIALLVLSLFMAFYSLRDSEDLGLKIEKFIHVFFTEKHADWIVRVIRLTDNALKKFLVGKLYTCVILGLAVSISIPIVNLITPLKIPYAPLIGFIIGITNIIPYIGPLIGTIPSLFFALFSGFWEAVGLLIIILVMQQIDNIIISPKILGNSVGLKPFWIVASVTIGGSLFGAIGMVLAVPIASVIQILVLEKMHSH